MKPGDVCKNPIMLMGFCHECQLIFGFLLREGDIFPQEISCPRCHMRGDIGDYQNIQDEGIREEDKEIILDDMLNILKGNA